MRGELPGGERYPVGAVPVKSVMICAARCISSRSWSADRFSGQVWL